MNNEDQDVPDLPDDQTATGSNVDRRLDWHDRELEEIRAELDRLRKSMDRLLAGDHERAAEILDEPDDEAGVGEGV